MPAVQICMLSAWAVVIGYLDWRYRQIPNSLSLSGWAVGGGLLMIVGSSLLGAPPSSALYAAGFATLVTLPGYGLGKLGAGDVKFLVAIGLLTSFQVTLQTFVLAALAGAGAALAWMSAPWLGAMLPERLTQTDQAIGRWLATPLHDRRMAYGTLIACALLYTLWKDVP